jgi:GAF domain-containing protein
LKRELSEAHRREVATAEVLKVISRSSFNLQEVLNSLIESAARLTGAEMGLIYMQDGEFYRAAAIYGASSEFFEVVKQNPIPPSRQSATGRAVLERRVIHIKDVIDDPEYTWAGQQGAKIRTILAVPMLREDVVVGVIVTLRTTVQPFTDKQIELLTTFADQAVIAIENTRLFEDVQARTRELQESLEYQTATSEVLGIISRSPSELQPVLDAITATARRLGKATRASIMEFKDGWFLLVNGPEVAGALRRLAAKVPRGVDRGTATSEVLDIVSRSKFELQPVFDTIVGSGLKLFSGAAVLITLPDGDKVKGAAVAASDPARAEAIMRRLPYPLTRDYMALAILDRRVVDIPGAASPPIELTIGAQNFLATGYRAVTIMPLMRGDDAIGTLSVLRIVPGPLSDNQIALLQTFADQAVIAIENTRLFEEVQARTPELAKTVDDLEIASQHKSQFVANMSHELRTPLAAILCYAELMQNPRPAEIAFLLSSDDGA